MPLYEECGDFDPDEWLDIVGIAEEPPDFQDIHPIKGLVFVVSEPILEGHPSKVSYIQGRYLHLVAVQLLSLDVLRC